MSIPVTASYEINRAEGYAYLSLDLDGASQEMQLTLDRISYNRDHEHFQLQGHGAQRIIRDVLVETGDLLVMTLRQYGSMQASQVWEVAIDKGGDDTQLLYPGEQGMFVLKQGPEEG